MTEKYRQINTRWCIEPARKSLNKLYYIHERSGINILFVKYAVPYSSENSEHKTHKCIDQWWIKISILRDFPALRHGVDGLISFVVFQGTLLGKEPYIEREKERGKYCHFPDKPKSSSDWQYSKGFMQTMQRWNSTTSLIY